MSLSYRMIKRNFSNSVRTETIRRRSSALLFLGIDSEEWSTGGDRQYGQRVLDPACISLSAAPSRRKTK